MKTLSILSIGMKARYFNSFNSLDSYSNPTNRPTRGDLNNTPIRLGAYFSSESKTWFKLESSKSLTEEPINSELPRPSPTFRIPIDAWRSAPAIRRTFHYFVTRVDHDTHQKKRVEDDVNDSQSVELDPNHPPMVSTTNQAAVPSEQLPSNDQRGKSYSST